MTSTDPADIGMETKLDWTGDVEAVVAQADQWAAARASHASVNTMGAELATADDDHLAVLSAVTYVVLK
jgi:hypothetical protein